VRLCSQIVNFLLFWVLICLQEACLNQQILVATAYNGDLFGFYVAYDCSERFIEVFDDAGRLHVWVPSSSYLDVFQEGNHLFDWSVNDCF
jgi:hypothetical protein